MDRRRSDGHRRGRGPVGRQALAAAGIHPTVVHTSLQTRAIRTANLALEEIRRPVDPGAAQLAAQRAPLRRPSGPQQGRDQSAYGEEQFLLWRRSYATAPPPLPAEDERSSRHDPRYAGLSPDVIPATECLADVVSRLLPYWHDALVADLKVGHIVLVAAHGNSLRALRKHLDGISDDDIVKLELPTGVPTVYELDEQLRPITRRDLS